MPTKTIKELNSEEEAATNEKQRVATEIQQAVDRQKENLAFFQQQENDVEPAMAAYGDSIKELKERLKEVEKTLAKKDTIPHRKELGEKVAECELPKRDKIKKLQDEIVELTTKKCAAEDGARKAEDQLQAIQAEFDKFKNKQADLDGSIKEIEELAKEIESRMAEQKTPDAATLFLLNELESALGKTPVISVKELKEQVLEVFSKLKTAKYEAREKAACLEALQAKLKKETSDRDTLEAGRRAKVLEELQAEAVQALGV